jgi:hypothetical protein
MLPANFVSENSWENFWSTCYATLPGPPSFPIYPTPVHPTNCWPLGFTPRAVADFVWGCGPRPPYLPGGAYWGNSTFLPQLISPTFVRPAPPMYQYTAAGVRPQAATCQVGTSAAEARNGHRLPPPGPRPTEQLPHVESNSRGGQRLTPTNPPPPPASG